jgi:hypothetical protein
MFHDAVDCNGGSSQSFDLLSDRLGICIWPAPCGACGLMLGERRDQKVWTINEDREDIGSFWLVGRGLTR